MANDLEWLKACGSFFDQKMLSTTVNITVNTDSAVSVRDQLVEQIGWQIAAGLLEGNAKLPSIRAMAKKLGIHHGVVSSAYSVLAESGMLDIRHGSGVRVVPMIALGQESDQSDLDSLFMRFVSQANALGYSWAEVTSCYDRFAERGPITKLVVVDRNSDFHPVILAELASHFSIPIVAITAEELHKDHSIFQNALVITSLYHFLSVQMLPLDRTRFMICNIEPVQETVDVIKALPASSMVLLVSVSSTLLKIGVNITAALRGESISVKAISAEDTKEIAFMTKYAKTIICDLPSKNGLSKIAGKIPVHVLKLYSLTTIQQIKDRLNNWG